jgi:hypothetical protein
MILGVLPYEEDALVSDYPEEMAERALYAL